MKSSLFNNPMKVSVCIPTYNQAQYLIQAIRSVCNQSLSPFEIIVSDDCSTDDTPDFLQKLSKEIPTLKVIRQPINLGIARNTDACLRLATGDFIVRLDSDDYLSPLYCEKLAKLLMNYPEAGYAHAAVQEINQHGDFLRQRKLARKPGFQSSSDALRAAINGYRVAANIIMFRREALIKVGYVTGRPNYVEDYHLSASLAATGYGNVYLAETLSFYRIWVDTGKVRQRRKAMEISGLHRVFEEVMEPAYKERGWNLNQLRKKRMQFACHQADCLGWDVYTAKEKVELLTVLSNLSSSPRAKRFAWLYLNGFGKIIKVYSQFMNLPRSIFKTLFLRLRA